MQNIRIINLLKSFTPAELKEFASFVDSPFFNVKKNLTLLFNEIKKHYPLFENKNFTKEKLYAKVFKSKTYNEKILNNHLSELLGLAEEYLAYKNYKRDGFTYRRHLINEVINRSENKLFDKNFKLAKDTLEQHPENFSKQEYFYNRYLLEAEKAHFNINNNAQAQSTENFLKIGENYIISLLIELSTTTFNLFANKHSFNAKIDFNLSEKFLKEINFEELIKYAEENKYENSHFVKIYSYLLMLFTHENKNEYYPILKNLIVKHHKLFNRSDLYDIYSCLRGYVTFQILKGNVDFNQQLFELHKDILAYNAYSYSENDFFPMSVFRNIILTAFDFQEDEFIEKFITKYKSKLAPENRDNMYFFGNGFIFFLRRQYDKSLENMSKVSNDIFLIKYDVKNIILKCCYELNYFDNAFEIVDTYRHFLSNNEKVTEERELWHYNFISFTNKLLKIKLAEKKERGFMLGEFLKKFDETPKISSRKWLQMKIDELKI